MIKNLSDLELHEQTVVAARNEKNATFILLEFLFEMDLRKAYVPRGFQGLWDYVNRGLGYSPQQTYERTNSVKLLHAVPEAKAAVESGELSLSSAAQIGRAINQEKKTAEEAHELFTACAGKSTREIERILLPDADAPAPDRVKPVSKTTTEIRIEVDEEFMRLLTRAKELSGDHTIKEVFRRTLHTYVRRKEPRTVATTTPKNPAPDGPPRIPKNRHIPNPIRNAVRTDSGDQCTFIDPQSKIRCASRTHLQMHHCNGYALFGTHEPENLRHLCATHHAWVEGRVPTGTG